MCIRDRFLVEQNARHALNLSDRAYVMVNGQIRLSGSGQTLLNDPEVRKACLLYTSDAADDLIGVDLG
ncbi:hypothetical protein ELO30_31560, partial [Klebsiella pneumoniae]|nr:hypothetical protein [Klebsiella pneumoniae]